MENKLFAFGMHSCFLKKGHNGFSQHLSKFILAATLLISIMQLALLRYLIFFLNLRPF